MKHFLANVLIGFVIFCSIWLTVEIIVTKVDVKNNYSYKYNYVYDNQDIKTLLIGNSFFEFGINPYMLGDSVFDFAIIGKWIYFDAQLAHSIFPTMPNLQTVIFPMGYTVPYNSYHYERLTGFHKRQIYYYAKFMHVYYDVYPDKYIYASALYHNRLGANFWKMKDVKRDPLGYVIKDTQCEDWVERAIFNPSIFSGDTASLCYNEYKEYLKDLAKTCYDNHLRFVVVTCPCADCYLDDVKEEGMRRLYDLVDSVKAYYPIEYYNYLNDVEFRADSIYYDAAHLNSKGADMLSVRLKHDLGL